MLLNKIDKCVYVYMFKIKFDKIVVMLEIDIRLLFNDNVIFVFVEKKDNEFLEERRMNRGKKKVFWGKLSFKGKVK